MVLNVCRSFFITQDNIYALPTKWHSSLSRNPTMLSSLPRCHWIKQIFPILEPQNNTEDFTMVILRLLVQQWWNHFWKPEMRPKEMKMALLSLWWSAINAFSIPLCITLPEQKWSHFMEVHDQHYTGKDTTHSRSLWGGVACTLSTFICSFPSSLHIIDTKWLKKAVWSGPTHTHT